MTGTLLRILLLYDQKYYFNVYESAIFYVFFVNFGDYNFFLTILFSILVYHGMAFKG